jgi:hypothetical protein
MPFYTVGARIPGCPGNPRLHITLACLGELNADSVDLKVCLAIIDYIVQATQSLPLRFGNGHHVMFGEKNDISAHHVQMLSNGAAVGGYSGIQEMLWRVFEKTNGKSSPGMTTRWDPFNYHITMDKPGVQDWLENHVDATGGIFTSPMIFVKAIGQSDPIRVWTLGEEKKK